MKRFFAVLAVLMMFAVPASALVWDWDCSSDPTADGSWVVREGGAFNNANLVDGVWLGGHTLDTRPLNNFNYPTTVTLNWKSAGANDWDACFWINADKADNTFAPVYAFLKNDGETQSLVVYNVYKSWDAQVIATVDNLPNDFVTTKLVFDPTVNTLTISNNGVALDPVAYTAWGPINADNFATVLGGKLMLDSIKIETVPEPATLLLIGTGLVGLLIRRRR